VHIVSGKGTTPDVLLALSRLIVDRWHDSMDGDSDAAAINLVVHSDGVSVTDLARQLGLSHSATVRVVDRLASRRLLLRDHTPKGRLVLVRATARGRALVAARLDAQHEWIETALAHLGEPRRRELFATLADLAERLCAGPDDADRACRGCDQTRCLARGCPLAHLSH
jgi:DNA-binding MarR family transcriptional regulator